MGSRAKSQGSGAMIGGSWAKIWGYGVRIGAIEQRMEAMGSRLGVLWPRFRPLGSRFSPGFLFLVGKFKMQLRLGKAGAISAKIQSRYAIYS